MLEARELPSFAVEVDADRDGEVEPGEPGHWDWRWSPDGPGAIALPDLGQKLPGFELTRLRLSISRCPEGTAVVLGLSSLAAPFVTLYRESEDQFVPILGTDGQDSLPDLVPFTETTELYLRPRQLPGLGFDGIVELTAMSAEIRPGGKVGITGRSDRAVIRVAPWIMTPNTCEPKHVFAVTIPTGGSNNQQFRDELTAACDTAKVPVTFLDVTRLPKFAAEPYDRWIQDEIEFGYVASPTATVDVVVDGPRNRGLDTIGQSDQLGSGLGSVLLDADFDVASSLDAFGNLEVSPPVVRQGRAYPLGRIVFGTKQPSDPVGQKASLRLRQFLYEQRLQTPFEIYSDWLTVGHVDEIVSFVPGGAEGGFRVLVASPSRALQLLDDLKATKLGNTVMWEGQAKSAGEPPGSAEETVDQLLARKDFCVFNELCQANMNAVVRDLIDQLGLSEEQIVPIPVLFESKYGGALAYFPDMVNHLVLGGISVVPKPYGPKVASVEGSDAPGEDIFERAFRDAVPDRTVIFIDDWLSYHKAMGEVHCGTNVIREPLPGVNWWEHRYDGVYNLEDTSR